ncbi:DNA-binding protein [Neobacillus drentensis]|uniref:DNA-binding protein n=1 Tax=Neobacillus drentensis TaxID=220684 RepID=UPI002FFEF4C9
MDKINKEPLENDFPNIGKPATRALNNAGYFKLDQLTHVTEAEILKLHGVGPKAVRILNEALQEKQLSFSGK